MVHGCEAPRPVSSGAGAEGGSAPLDGSVATDPSAGFRGDPVEQRFRLRWAARVKGIEDATERSRRWVEFIKGIHERVNFQWFSTLTFQYPVHPESAVKAYEKWQHLLNRKIYGVRYYRRGEGLSSLVAVEYQKRGVLHFHALNAGVNVPGRRQAGAILDENAFTINPGVSVEMRRFYAMDLWATMAGYARIYPFREAGGAESYVSKYVVKGGDIFPMGHFTPTARQLVKLEHFAVQEGGG